MTGLYDLNPLPHTLDIQCPTCQKNAQFEFAEVVRIPLKKDVPFFQDSSLFDYQMFKDGCGHKWHGAVYYPGLHGSSLSAIRDLPEGFETGYWGHSRYMYRNHGLDIGSIRCSDCNLNSKHELSWPNDAYYSIEYKNQILWAFDKESAVELRNYIDSDERDLGTNKLGSFLLHIPTIFKKQSARKHVVKKLDKLLV